MPDAPGRAALNPALAAIAAEMDGPDKAVIVTDPSGAILSWSSGAERMYGWRSDEVLGRHVLGVTPTTMSMGEGARIMSLLQAGVPWSGSFVVRTRQGEEIVAEVLDVPVRSEDGKLIGIVGVSRPVARPTP